ncbi:hypothetical protein G7Y89_g8151 [Cudoniella acicularis]|uniref:Uncharacterized protein n=1 Tax=Cudoniella acicularis TaxID=354080 RepID=A0A8H4RH34_9HELO|nr:hypothetical protein G7Y89_g8151 [Cudoniella acicularis]
MPPKRKPKQQRSQEEIIAKKRLIEKNGFKKWVAPPTKVGYDKIIRHELAETYDLCTEEREKLIASTEDVEQFLSFLWKDDAHNYVHERIRAQIAAGILLIAYTAVRPGTVVVSTAYKRETEKTKDGKPAPLGKALNDSIKYKDLEFLVHENPDPEDKTPLVQLKVKFRLMKGDRFIDKKYDNAFEDTISPDYFYTPFFGKPKTVQFKASIMETPVFQSPACLLGKKPGDPWSYSGWHNGIKGVWRRMGFKPIPTSYSVRRGALNSMIGLVSKLEIGLIMGHEDQRTTQKSYVSHDIRVDLQGIFNKRSSETMKKLIQDSQRLDLHRYPDVPTKLPEEDMEAILWSAEIENLRRERDQARDSTLWEERDKILRSTKRRLINKALEDLRDEHIQKIKSDYSNTSRNLQNESEQQNSTLLYPLRAKVVDLFYNSPDLPPEKRSLDLVCNLRRQTKRGQAIEGNLVRTKVCPQ